jgi:hypothetical protein
MPSPPAPLPEGEGRKKADAQKRISLQAGMFVEARLI